MKKIKIKRDTGQKKIYKYIWIGKEEHGALNINEKDEGEKETVGKEATKGRKTRTYLLLLRK